MDIFEAIERDHEMMLAISRDLVDSDAKKADKRRERLADLRTALIAHEHAEEQIFYPALIDAGLDKQMMFGAYEEHRVASSVLEDLEQLPVENERWTARMKVLHELIEQHIEEEEDEIFDEARDIIDDIRATDMARQFEEVRTKGLSQESGGKARSRGGGNQGSP